MPRAAWPLADERPVIEVELVSISGLRGVRRLLADTGAGTGTSRFDLILHSRDGLSFAKRPFQSIRLRGAYRGWFPVYQLGIEIPSLGLAMQVVAVAVPTPPKGLDGIAAFRFLNRFTYGNFGDARQFGLET